MSREIKLDNEFYYEMEKFSLVAQGTLTGDYKIIEKDSFGYMIVMCNENGGKFIIKPQQ